MATCSARTQPNTLTKDFYVQDELIDNEGNLLISVIAGATAFEGCNVFEDNLEAIPPQKPLVRDFMGGNVDELADKKDSRWVGSSRSSQEARQLSVILYNKYNVREMGAE